MGDEPPSLGAGREDAPPGPPDGRSVPQHLRSQRRRGRPGLALLLQCVGRHRVWHRPGLQRHHDRLHRLLRGTGNDEANLLACILVKGYNPKKIIARISDPSHADAFKKVGIDATVSPELSAASYLEKLIIRPKIADMIILGRGNAELLDIPIENKKAIGKKISDLSPTKDYIICAVYKSPDYEILMPESNMILEDGDRISILIKTQHIKEVVKIFLK